MNEDLATGLQKTLNLMSVRIELQNKRNNIRAQYVNPFLPKSPLKKSAVIAIVLVIIVVLKSLFSINIARKLASLIAPMSLVDINAARANSSLSYWDINDLYLAYNKAFSTSLLITNIIIIGISILCALAIKAAVNKNIANKNRQIDDQNIEINERNQVLERAETEVIQQIKNVQLQYANEIAPWYPSNYCTIEAAEFFLNCIYNHRADSLKEAINLYEDTIHKRRMEYSQQQILNKQEEMVKQQNLANVLAIGGLVMQAGIQNSINNNTRAVNAGSAGIQNSINNNTNAVNNLRTTIKNKF